VHGGIGDRLHIRLTDVFGNHGDAELPKVDLFIICC
jgi:hypothetical protein